MVPQAVSTLTCGSGSSCEGNPQVYAAAQEYWPNTSPLPAVSCSGNSLPWSDNESCYEQLTANSNANLVTTVTNNQCDAFLNNTICNLSLDIWVELVSTYALVWQGQSAQSSGSSNWHFLRHRRDGSKVQWHYRASWQYQPVLHI
jgi:hypothetical protein